MKKCSKHVKYFPDENPWLPATTEYFFEQLTGKMD